MHLSQRLKNAFVAIRGTTVEDTGGDPEEEAPDTEIVVENNRSPRRVKSLVESDDLEMLAQVEEHSRHWTDKLKDGFALYAGTFVPFVLMVILGLSNGYLFSGFRDFTWSTPILIAYVIGYSLEVVGTSGIFIAQRGRRDGNSSQFRWGLTLALFMAFVSLTSQFTYLQVQSQQGFLSIPDTAIEHMPIISWLVGVGGLRGHDWLFILRSVAIHVAEIGCTFVISQKKRNLKQLIAQQEELLDAQLTLQRKRLAFATEQSIHNYVVSLLGEQQAASQRVMSQLVGMMRQGTPALPSPSQDEEGDSNTGPLVFHQVATPRRPSARKSPTSSSKRRKAAKATTK